MIKHRPVPASLDDPLYYLENMDILVAWVANHHADLLTEQERSRLAAYTDLATGPRAAPADGHGRGVGERDRSSRPGQSRRQFPAAPRI